jgi:hypothetical protein
MNAFDLLFYLEQLGKTEDLHNLELVAEDQLQGDFYSVRCISLEKFRFGFSDSIWLDKDGKDMLVFSYTDIDELKERNDSDDGL